jgi:hypothetical protein
MVGIWTHGRGMSLFVLGAIVTPGFNTSQVKSQLKFPQCRM